MTDKCHNPEPLYFNRMATAIEGTNNIIFETEVPHWGILHSTEFSIFRNAMPSGTVTVHNIGVSWYPPEKPDQKLFLKFQCLESESSVGKKEDYTIDVHVSFLQSLKPPYPDDH